MAHVVYDRVTLQYPGTDRPAVTELSLDIADGEFLVLVGPSGCGKSTALRILAGLEPITSGQVLIDDEDVTGLAPKNRDIAMVFQNYALYPHMTVAENMGFALKISGMPKAEREQRVREVARHLDLTDYLQRKPKALSGGQRQRVAMGRAIVREPRVFLMDEPLSNLDAKLRVQTRTRIAALQRDLGVTTLYVTHDQTEALTMGDRIAVMKLGVLQQLGTPRELLDRPTNTFVAGFIGSPAMNLLEGLVTEHGVEVGGAVWPIARDVRAAVQGNTITLGVRPEDFRLLEERSNPAGLDMRVMLVEELGADGYLHGRTTSADAGSALVVRVDGRTHPFAGDQVAVAPDPSHTHVFQASTGERIGTLAGLD